MDKNVQYIRKRVFRSMLAVLLIIAVTMSSMPQTTQAAVKRAVTVSTQTQLNSALADKNIRTITIKTTAAKKLTIPKKSYKTKTLILNGSKLIVNNSGIFKKITVKDASVLTDYAKGNSITINDKKITVKVPKKAAVKDITLSKTDADCKIEVSGTIGKMSLSKKTKLQITGKASDFIPIQLKAAAKGSRITSSTLIDVKSPTDTKIILKKGAEKSKITSTDNNANITVENKTNKSLTLTTPDGKKTVAAGKTVSSRKLPVPTQAPEDLEDSEDSEDSKTEPTPTVIPGQGNSGQNSSGGTKSKVYTVEFDSAGGTSIDSVRLLSGSTIGNLPSPQKSNSIFLGWYTDSGLQNKFTDSSPVYSNLILYARYSEIETQQQNLNDTYTLTDQNASLAFTISSSDTAMTADSVKSCLVLEIADGSQSVDLTVSGTNGTYTVSAQNGFTEGASYLLTLNDSRLNFSEKDSTIRKCSFNIKKAEVYNIELNDGIIYIPSVEVSDMTQNGAKADALSVSIVSMSADNSGDNTASGIFTYKGSRILKVGDVLCIYSGDKPKAPAGNGGDEEYLDDNIAYITVASVMGTPGNQVVNYTDADAEEVIFMPDVLPVFSGEGNKLGNFTAATADAPGSFTVAASDLNFSAFADLGLSTETTLDKGDFLAFYTGNFSDAKNAASVIYGEVTACTENSGNLTVSFTATTEEKMQEVLDYYSKNDVDSEVLLDDVNIASLEKDIEKQVQESGFAEEASSYLTALAMETDGFKNIAGDDFSLESLSVKMPDGSDGDLNDMSIMSMSSKVSIENLKVRASIGKNLQKLSGSGVRCAVTVSFDVPIEAGDDSAIVISISATFVEELKVAVNASGKAVWKKKWIFPYIADYQMNANIDLYDYTGISFKAVVSSASTGSTDISEEIQKILSYTKSEQITAGVQELFELYGDMMENETDWVDIFSQNIVKNDMHLLLGIINIRTTVDFVVSANVNVALGCNFEYQSGTRYCFWAKIKAKDAGSNQIDLMDEKYTFQFYVMGTLGLRAGIRLEFAVGLFSVNLNSIGLTAEAGVYTRLYGYFFYQLESVNKLKNSRMSGALYLDFGIYLEIAFKAQVLNGKYQYNPTLYENEWPLLSVGTRYNVYNFAYDNSASIIKLKDTVRSYTLPDSTFNMTYLDLKEGDISTKAYKVSDYNITFSNSNFSIVGNTVKVNVPAGTHKLDCDMTVAWKSSPLAFSSVPMTRTFRLVWDDLNDNGYTITYNSNGGSQVNSTTKKYDEKVTAPKNPVKTGYTFEGWYSDVNLTSKYSFSTMPAQNIELYAKWTANTNTQYKIEHYQQNLENDNYSLTATETLAGTTGSTAMATAKTYTGFTYTSSVKESVSSGNIAADGSLVLKLYYNRNSYTLTFRPDNGGNDLVKTVKYGASVSAPTVVKTGYTFMGWDKIVSETMPAANTTYTAQWNPISYKIEFNTNGGSTVNAMNLPYDTNISAPAAPVKPGYIFAGWYRDSNLTTAFNFTTMQAENITLYAKWELNNQITYKVEHYQQNVSGTGYTLQETENLTGTFDTTVNATAKTFAGFTYNAGAAESVASGKIAADGSLVLKLYYDRNSYTISFVTNGGSSMDAMTGKYAAAVTAPVNPTRAGYIFEGWYSDDDLTVRYNFSTIPAENTTLYAKWTVGTNTPYKTEYYQQNIANDNYTLFETETLSGTTGNTATAATKTYTGFTYDSSVDETVSTGTIAADGSLVLKLYYDRNSYTLTFKPENGENDTEVTVKYGAAITAPNLSRTGYTFSGWDKTVAETMPAADTTYMAQWTPNDYTIEFIANGGSTVGSITQAYKTTVNAPIAPTRAGYLFSGWFSDTELKVPYTFTTMPSENITLYAKWEINNQITYKVEHYQQNVSGTGYTLQQTENLTGTFDATVNATAKTFAGFTYKVDAAESVATGKIAADGSLVLKLYYDRNTYTISFVTNGGSSVDAMTGKYGTPVIAPVNLTKSGYIFEGWYSDDDLTVRYNFSTMPAENTTLYAKWTAGTNTPYKTEYYQQNIANENYTLKETETLSGTTGSTATATTKTYAGFTYDSSVDETVSTGTIAADGSLVLKLYYDRNSYTLTFKPENGENDTEVTVKYGAAITAPNLSRTGYTFSGWDKTVAETMPAADTTYTAQWTPDDYTIEFITNGGSTVGSITQAYTTTVNAPSAPTRAGYLFSGWFSDTELTVPYTFTTMPSENITLYAKWEINNQITYKVEHYQQNVSGTGYTLQETENLTGTFDTTVNATAKTFAGFTYKVDAAESVATGKIAADGSLVLKLYYDRNTYTISFVTNGGSSVDAMTEKYGTPVITPVNPAKSGYLFGGWYSDEAFSTSYNLTTMPSENITLYAKWELNTNITYKIEHYQQNVSDTGYTLAETENLNGTFDTTVNATAKTFEGFTYNAGAAETVASGKIAADGSLVLKLYYDRNTYTISFVTNEGSSVDAMTGKYGTTVTAPVDPVRPGYTFSGWYMDSNFTMTYNFSTMPAMDFTLYAKWESNTVSEERLEGENAVIYGGAEVEYNPAASNGAHVGYIDHDGAGVKFDNLKQSDSIILRYASDSFFGPVIFSIFINNVYQGKITLLDTGSYMSYSTTKINGLNLAEGDSLSFQYQSGDEPINVDYISYSASSIDTQVALQRP